MILREGLVENGRKAFGRCISLPQIAIPPAVSVICESAFMGCLFLTSAVFSDEIEELCLGN